MICRCELFRVERGGRQVVLERRASQCGSAQFRRGGGRHGREPIELSVRPSLDPRSVSFITGQC
jgi:hypothetical protein